MSDNEGAASQADTKARSQADTGDTETTAGATPETIDSLPKWAQDLIRTTRKEAATHRTKAQQLEDAGKTELQKAMDRAAELEKRASDTATELQRERAEKTIRDAAASAGARADRLASVYRLIRDDVKYDDDGRPDNVDALIAQAQKDAPEFFARVTGSGDGGKGSGDTGRDPNAGVNAAIRSLAGHG